MTRSISSRPSSARPALLSSHGLSRPLAIAVVALGGCVIAASAPARAQDAGVSTGELSRQIEQRDAVIRDLSRRIEALERKTAPAAAPAPAAAQPPATSTATAGAPPPPPAAAAASAKPAPGAIEVDEKAAERALERTLVASGALLVPAGQVEIEPSFNYTRREIDDVPVLVDIGGDSVLANQQVKRNELTASVGVRVGLPWDSQLELALPYSFTQEDQTLDVGSAGRDTRDGWGSGLGDFSVGLAKTVLREGRWTPDLIARASYNTGSGDKSDNDIALNGGFSAVTGSLVAVKRQDPLAFVGSGFYQKTFKDSGTNPGDQYGFTLGTFLAASPETSLRFQFQTTFVDDLETGGRTINNSNRVEGVFIFGASSILGRGVLLDVSGGVGMTDDAPDYFINIALPIRFDLPIL